MISLPDFKEKQIVFVRAEWGEKSTLRFLNDHIVFLKDGKVINRTSCHKAFAVFVMGDIAVTTKLIQRAAELGVSFFFLKPNFEVYASFRSQADGNWLLRMKQYGMSGDKELWIAKNIVKAKVINQMELLGSIGTLYSKQEKQEILQKIESAKDNQSLLGLEGNFSKSFFQQYFAEIGWRRRAPRTKEDIQNFLLDMGYTFLFNFVDSLLRLHGFDTFKGCYHKLFFSRRSLACDLTEPFRCIIEHQLVKSYNLKQIVHPDFIFSKGKYSLPFQNNQKYAQIFLQALMDNKEDIFSFVQGFYRFIMDEKNEFPEYRIKLKKKFDVK